MYIWTPRRAGSTLPHSDRRARASRRAASCAAADAISASARRAPTRASWPTCTGGWIRVCMRRNCAGGRAQHGSTFGLSRATPGLRGASSMWAALRACSCVCRRCGLGADRPGAFRGALREGGRRARRPGRSAAGDSGERAPAPGSLRRHHDVGRARARARPAFGDGAVPFAAETRRLPVSERPRSRQRGGAGVPAAVAPVYGRAPELLQPAQPQAVRREGGTTMGPLRAAVGLFLDRIRSLPAGAARGSRGGARPPHGPRRFRQPADPGLAGRDVRSRRR